MARMRAGSAEYIRPRFSRWLRTTMEDLSLDGRQLAEHLVKRRSHVEPSGAYRQLVRDWLAERKTVAAQTAYEIGEIFAEAGATWSCGLVALYAAGHIADTVAQLDRLASSSSGFPMARAFVLSQTLPWLANEVPRPAEPDHVTAFVRAQTIARAFASDAVHERGEELREHWFAWQQRPTVRGMHPLLRAAYKNARDGDLDTHTAHQVAMLIVDDWAHHRFVSDDLRQVALDLNMQRRLAEHRVGVEFVASILANPKPRQEAK